MVILGAGGHARSVIALLKNIGQVLNGVYDDSWTAGKNEQILGVPVSGKLSDVPANEEVCLAVGDNALREKLFNSYSKSIYKKTIKHTTSWIEEDVVMGEANLVFGNAFVNAGAKIGNNNILNTGCIVEHECEIGNHNHISVSSALCGRVKIGNNCFIGAKAVVKDKVSICDNVTIGAGAVVVKNITEPGVYVGNPAKKIK